VENLVSWQWSFQHFNSIALPKRIATMRKKQRVYMKSFSIIKATLTSLIFALTVNVMAQTIEKYTAVSRQITANPRSIRPVPGGKRDDLEIKNIECKNNDPTYLRGMIVNRTMKPVARKIRVLLYDMDGDIIWQTVEEVKIGAQSGAIFKTHIEVGTCMPPHAVETRIENQ
jgi:hypothetical protein